MSQPEQLDDETENLVLRAGIYLLSQQDRPQAEWSPKPEGVTGLHLAIARGRMTDRHLRNAQGIAAHRKALSTALTPLPPREPGPDADQQDDHSEDYEGEMPLWVIAALLVLGVPGLVGIWTISTWLWSYIP